MNYLRNTDTVRTTTFLTNFGRALLVSSLLVVTAACSPTSSDVTVKTKISEAEIGRRIERLASDAFEGREPGTKGGLMASQYIADEMKASGLVPMGENGTYFQPVTLTRTTVEDTSFMNLSKDGETVHEYGFQKDSVYWTKRYKDSVAVDHADLVFVGYGVVAPEFNWNDYAGLDVKGKTVVMLVNDPGFGSQDEELFKGNVMTYYGRWTYKFEEAARQGAAAALIVHETKPASYGWNVVSDSWAGAQIDLVRPDAGASRAALEGWISVDAARDLFSSAGLEFDALKTKAAQVGFKPIALTGFQLSAKIDNHIETVKSRNVVGAIKGTKTPDEYVLYMGHWDHLGTKPSEDGADGIYNGAVDNATGTAAILEIGDLFAQNPPKRSVLIAAVTAEESGLLGSAYYAEAPVVPLHKTVAGINIDAILPLGRTKDMVVVGYGASELDDRLQALLKPRDMYIRPDPKPEAGYYYRSDHISLAKKGVPMLYADSGIDHEVNGKTYGEAFGEEYTKERYHAPSDEYDHSWDLSGIVQVSTIFYELGQNLSDTKTWPNWYEGAEFRALRDDMLKTNTP